MRAAFSDSSVGNNIVETPRRGNLQLLQPRFLREWWSSGCEKASDFDKRLFMVINAYVDESYAEPRTFALGCALARGMDWFEIARQWKKVIDRKNRELEKTGRRFVSRYHSSDCNNMRGDFEGWEPPERDAFITELIGIVNKNKIRIVGHTVDLSEVEECFPTRKSNPKRTAFLVLSVLLWKAIGEQARRIHRDPNINVVYECGPFNGIGMDSYDALRRSDLLDRVLFRGVSFDDSSVAPLQIADLVAYESMKEHDRQASGRDRRHSLKALLKRTAGSGIHVRGEALRRVAKGYWEKVLRETLERAEEQ